MLVRIALHPVLLGARALSFLEGTGFVLAEECSNREVGIGIQQLQAADVDVVGDVRVTSRKIGATPGNASTASAGGATFTGRLDVAAKFADNLLQLMGVAALDLLRNAAIAEDDEGREGRDGVLSGDRLAALSFDIDLNEGGYIAPGQ